MHVQHVQDDELMVSSAVLLFTTGAFALQASRPNVLFIVVDDLGVATSNYGFPAAAPNLEALAARSTQFRRAYVSMAVCAPSRTAFLTGMRPDTTRVWTIGPYFRTSAENGMNITTLPQLFRRNGYITSGSGKIFHPGQASGGVSSSEGGGDMCPAASSTNNCSNTAEPDMDAVGSWTEPYFFCDQYTNDTVQSPAMQQWGCSRQEWPSCGTGCVQSDACVQCFERAKTWGVNGLAWAAADCPDECYPEGLIANRAIDTLERYANGSLTLNGRSMKESQQKHGAGQGSEARAPFFLAVGFKRPHLTYKAPAKYFDMYDPSAIDLPLHSAPHASAPPLAFSHSCVASNELVKPYGVNESCRPDGLCTELVSNVTTVRELRRAYYAVISLMDHHLGRVLQALDRLGLSNNTIVSFIGDHGYQNGEKGQWCKSNNLELATRIPMLIAPPLGSGNGHGVGIGIGSGTDRDRDREIGGGDAAWGRGVVSDAIVESVDLLPTIADMAGVSLPPGQTVAGTSLVPLLKGSGEARTGSGGKGWALSQWPRRPSCLHAHTCVDGHGDPSTPAADKAWMGYTLRVPDWRYTAWFEFDYDSSQPVFSNITARELYPHAGDKGDVAAAESFEFVNVAEQPEHAGTVRALHAQLLQAIRTGLVKPVRPHDDPDHA